MNALHIMKALGEIPEDIVKCYFDEAASSSEIRSQCTVFLTDEQASNELSLKSGASSERQTRLPIPVSVAAIAACLLLAVGWGFVISRLNGESDITQNHPNNSQDDSHVPLITASSTTATNSKPPETEESSIGTTSPTTPMTLATTNSATQISETSITIFQTNTSLPETTAEQSETLLSIINSEAITSLSSDGESTAQPETTTIPKTTETTSLSETTVNATIETEEPPIPCVGENVILSFIHEEWENVDYSHWKAENEQLVKQTYYQALSAEAKIEIQKKITLLESNSNMGYAMKLREQIMGRDAGAHLSLEELKAFYAANPMMDEAFEMEVMKLILQTNRVPDIDFGSGMSYSYYFLDETGKYALYTVNGASPRLVYYEKETAQLVSTSLHKASSIIQNL